ncbi:substrate-binding domain-containing protein [Desulfovirgula thermocuniculi]|uniref:substrate-binding domain-containing protein n=1 Tax=Desulfovirgula thermocuniculi TaxID=348842 RepID=UPI000423E9F2|nr:substrate-binding domain-containing protein [Desulfovirgula thermocuniculi]
MFKRAAIFATGIFLVLVLLGGCGSRSGGEQKPAGKRPAKQDVILATTTSTQDSGLLDVLVPEFEKRTGYRIKVIAVGTGQALEMGKRGEADVLLVHSPQAERELVDSGVGINYRLVMHNDFVLVGPENDPAGVKAAKSAAEAFKKIAATQSTFVSRGDESGTHKKEKEIWQEAGIAPGGRWYQEAGTGMGNTLNIASEKGGYTLSDRATYLANQKHLKLKILLEGDKSLLNIYHVMQVNPDKFAKVNAAGAKAFVDFLVSPEGQQIIGSFGVDKYGQPLFFPDAGKKEEELGGTR